MLIIYNLIHHSARSHSRYILGYTYTMALNDAGRPVKESQFTDVVSAIACSIQMGTVPQKMNADDFCPSVTDNYLRAVLITC